MAAPWCASAPAFLPAEKERFSPIFAAPLATRGKRSDGREARHRSAKPSTPVRIRFRPQRNKRALSTRWCFFYVINAAGFQACGDNQRAPSPRRCAILRINAADNPCLKAPSGTPSPCVAYSPLTTIVCIWPSMQGLANSTTYMPGGSDSRLS